MGGPARHARGANEPGVELMSVSAGVSICSSRRGRGFGLRGAGHPDCHRHDEAQAQANGGLRLRFVETVAGGDMHHSNRTTALDLMMDLMGEVLDVIGLVAVHDKNLSRQMRSSSESVISNHGEANGVTRGHRRERIETAYGSLCELRTQLKLVRVISRQRQQSLDAKLDRVGAIGWRRLKAAG